MLLAHKIELRPTKEQATYLDKACGSRRHCYNQLLAHFKDNKWSKSAAYQHYIKVIRVVLQIEVKECKIYFANSRLN
jgi:putative transposase